MSCPGFGELNIPSSRAFWDDCEEDELENLKPVEKLQLKFDDESAAPGVPLESDLLLVIEGVHVTHFGTSVLGKDSNRVCGIPAKTSSLQWNPSSKQLLAVLEEDLTSSGEVTELLLPYAKLAKKVITLTLKPKVEFKSENIQFYRDHIAIVRGVGVNQKDVTELEAPNFIAGVAAGVASWRNQEELPVSSFVIYTDKLPLDSTAAQPVIKLLQSVGVSCSSGYIPPRKENSYLYM
ncbi:uncharacterized protein LOC128252551 [Drosophila gunungcola]|uniref:Proteasome assembly chaperone 1 n=1 Tax=Drosophila gunungcola TaxID=103775 RepID=A0A9P9Z0D6_9MUSC|nr:uncharacterized protein LOC128252551 [Drosophila gunungcola]KAI8046260.1 hypothetical protein M5D96_002462 [Drosophila gunungcola]